MNVLDINEHKDGSATINLNCTDEEINLLVQYAILDILKRSLAKMNKDAKEQ